MGTKSGDEYWSEGGDCYAGTMQRAAEAVTVSERTLAKWFRQGCPNEKGRYNVSAIVRWARAKKWTAPASADPMLADGGDSVWLEKYRRERALMARMERKQRQGELVRVSDMMDLLLPGAGLIREAGERIGRSWPEAQQILNEAIDELCRTLETTADTVRPAE